VSAEFVLYYRLEIYFVFSAFLNQKQTAPDIFTFEILDDQIQKDTSPWVHPWGLQF